MSDEHGIIFSSLSSIMNSTVTFSQQASCTLGFTAAWRRCKHACTCIQCELYAMTEKYSVGLCVLSFITAEHYLYQRRALRTLLLAVNATMAQSVSDLYYTIFSKCTVNSSFLWRKIFFSTSVPCTIGSEVKFRINFIIVNPENTFWKNGMNLHFPLQHPAIISSV